MNASASKPQSMASFAFIIPYTFFILLALSPSLVTATSVKVPNDHFTRIFAFGDSYTDTGNTKSGTGPQGFMQVSNPPYGMTHFHHSTNRYSDGRLVIDFVAETLSLPYLPPYLNPKADRSHGVNFAVAGATAIDHSFFVRNNLTLNITPQSILTELAWFRKFLKSRGCNGTDLPACRAIMKDSLFWIGEIGVNDFAYNLGATVPDTLVQKLAIDSITLFLQVFSSYFLYLICRGNIAE